MCKYGKRMIAGTMAVWMLAVCAAPAGAAVIDSGVAPTCDEAYYASLDYYGNLLEGSVVKSYALNGASAVTDYGVYDQVVNLTDATPVSLGEGTADFRFGQAPDRFYFEGRTAQPFQDLPWTVSLHYTLNGVPARAEELAGQKGVVEILVDIVPNERAGDYARYNYTLEAMALFNQDNILSLEAPGAQVQLVGNLRTVLFMALPGEEAHFAIRVGSDDFSFDGLTVLMVPATLSQLEEIAKLSQRKEELEKDYRALSGSLDALLDALNDIQSGLYASADGLDRLNDARGTISDGKGQIYSDAGTLRDDLSNIADILEPVQERTRVFSQAVTDSKAVLGDMADTALALKGQLDSLDEALKALEEGTGDVKRFMECTADLKDSLNKLEKALKKVNISANISMGPIDIDPGTGGTSATELVDKVVKAHGAYEAVQGGSRKDAFTALLMLQGESASNAAAKAEQADKLADAPDVETAAAAVKAQVRQQVLAAAGLTEESFAKLPAEQQTAVQGQIDGAQQRAEAEVRAQFPDVQRLNGLYNGTKGLGFQQFCEQLPGVSKEQAKQMNDLWTVYSGGAKSAGLASSAWSGWSGGVLAGAMAGSMLSENTVLAGLPAEDAPSNVPQEGNGGTDPAAEAADSPDGGVGSAAVDIIAGGLDDISGKLNSSVSSINNSINRAIRDMNRQLADFQDELNDTLRDVARPASAVAGELADLCGQLDSLTYLLDDAKDLSAAVRQFSPQIKELLDQMDSLRGVLDTYEPVVQESLANAGALSTSAAASLRDLETLLADTENLMRTSGVQLDEGTKQTLRGLSASLRQTGKALSTTQGVKEAKNALADILEDTWHEYTGDVNNILMMDAGAQPVSLTDSRNPAPSSVQVLIRTQEIKEREAEENTAQPLAAAAGVSQPDTFWGRVLQMLRDFWRAVVGIFH